MKLYCILFLLAAVLKLSDSCLVIRYSEPPACACKTLKLDSSNIIANKIQNNSLYNYVFSSTIKSPEIMVDDCFVQMYCEDGYELYIFDSDKGAKIGDYSLDGFCDPYQQKWQVDPGNGLEQYKELKGVCALKTGCACPYLHLDSSNIDLYLGGIDSYKNDVKGYAIQAPEITEYKDGCQFSRKCPEGFTLYTVWYPLKFNPRNIMSTAVNASWTSRCDKEKKGETEWLIYWWRPIVTNGLVNFLSAVCVDFSHRV
ncbi:unnamed protein product [Caenorhabditis nigoni]